MEDSIYRLSSLRSICKIEAVQLYPAEYKIPSADKWSLETDVWDRDSARVMAAPSKFKIQDLKSSGIY